MDEVPSGAPSRPLPSLLDPWPLPEGRSRLGWELHVVTAGQLSVAPGNFALPSSFTCFATLKPCRSTEVPACAGPALGVNNRFTKRSLMPDVSPWPARLGRLRSPWPLRGAPCPLLCALVFPRPPPLLGALTTQQRLPLCFPLLLISHPSSQRLTFLKLFPLVEDSLSAASLPRFRPLATETSARCRSAPPPAWRRRDQPCSLCPSGHWGLLLLLSFTLDSPYFLSLLAPPLYLYALFLPSFLPFLPIFF